MLENTKEENTCEILLTRALSEELNHIKRNVSPDGCAIPVKKQVGKLDDVFEEFHKENLSALCFSGGGIRSATFGLGIVQSLAKHGLLDKFDYLSTVSGGGYLGSWLSAWIRREQISEEEKRVAKLESLEKKISARLEKKNLNSFKKVKLAKLREKIIDLIKTENVKLFKEYQTIQASGIDTVRDKLNKHSTAQPNCPNIEPKQLQYLREYSNYMSPRVGLLSADTWTLLAIYTRNLFLNWTIFVPLLAAILLIPRIILAFTNSTEINGWLAYLMLPIGLLTGSVAVAFVVNKLPSKNTDTAEVRHDTDGWILAFGILPLVILALTATTFWAWVNYPGNTDKMRFEFLPAYLKLEFLPSFLKTEPFGFIAFTVSLFLIGYWLFQITKRPWVKIDYRGIIAAFVSSLVGGFVMWLIAHNWLAGEFFLNAAKPPFILPLYVCLAVPVYLLIFLVSATIFVGLSSMFVTDSDREWLARFGAWILIVCGAWLVLNALVLFGPIGIEDLIAIIKKPPSDKNWIEYASPIVPLIAAISGFLSLAGGFSGKSPVTKDEPTKSNLSKFLAVAPKIAGVVFLGFLLVGLAYVSGAALDSVGSFLNNHSGQYATLQAFLSVHPNAFSQTSIVYLFSWLIVLSAIGIVMACFINVNKFSLHGAYRDRLIRAYLGASHVARKGNTFTGFDDSDNFQLHRLRGQKPFHVINATLNLVDGKNLAWQNRKAASFTMSPLHCGSWLLGYRYTNEYSRNQNFAKCEHLRYCNEFGNPCPLLDKSGEPCLDETGKIIFSTANCQKPGKSLRLGTAMAISGAAANPNMGYYSSPVVTFLMSLFNIRLGWWLGNTGAIGDTTDHWGDKFYTKTSPSIAVLPLINETFGRTDENKRYLNITDGGHFENLGIYEMVLRRCKLIVVSDAAADENFTYGEISNAIEKCKVDLGVTIKFHGDIEIYARQTAKNFEKTRQRFAVAEIIYPERKPDGGRQTGYLLYIRPAFYGTEPIEIENYANANKTFPHQSTADQLYDEKQFEAYRALGFFIMEEIIGNQSPDDLSELINGLRENGIEKAQVVVTQILPELLRAERADVV